MEIILAIIALCATVWAFIEKYGKSLLKKIIADLNIDITTTKATLKKTEFQLDEERSLLKRERAFSADLQKKLAEPAPEPAEPLIQKMASALMSAAPDVDGLVGVSESFQIGDGEKTVHFEFYKDRPSEIRWRLKARNNKILADSGEGYSSKQGLKKALTVMLTSLMNGDFKARWKS